MREIEFRGMDKVNQKWLYGNLEIPLVCRNHSRHYILGYSYGQYQKHEVEPKTVGQFTGLTDKNGKEIYEGDIVEWDEKEWGSPFKEVVEWDYELFSSRKNDWKQFCVIIGNIHENN